MPVQDERKALIEEGVNEAFTAEGYVKPDGSRDHGKLRDRIFEVLRPNQVTAPNERDAKAVTRGDMIERVFPNLPLPPDYKGAKDQVLADDVWSKLNVILWTEQAQNASKALQGLVGRNMGNGYVLCRTKVGRDRTWATYITDDVRCIEQDFVRPDNDALERKIKALVANRKMLINRQPENAARWLKGFDRHVRALGATAHEQLALAMEAATANGQPEDSSDEA